MSRPCVSALMAAVLLLGPSPAVAAATVAATMAEPDPAPMTEPEPAPVAEPDPAPVAEPGPAPVAEPAAEPGPAPTAEPGSKPAAEPGPAPAAEPHPAPATEPRSAPATEPHPAPAAEPASRRVRSPGDRMVQAGVGMVVAGLVGYGLMAVGLGIGNRAEGDLRPLLERDDIEARHQVLARGQRGNRLAIAGAVTATVAMAVGIPLIIVGRRRHEASTPHAALSVGGAAGNLAVQVRGRF